MEACGYDAYDCSLEEGQVLRTSFVRFVCVPSLTDTHPVVSYIRETFYQTRETDYTCEDLTCMGRVTVADDSSYVSIDLGDLSSLGYTVYSVELLNDGM